MNNGVHARIQCNPGVLRTADRAAKCAQRIAAAGRGHMAAGYCAVCSSSEPV